MRSTRARSARNRRNEEAEMNERICESDTRKAKAQWTTTAAALSGGGGTLAFVAHATLVTVHRRKECRHTYHTHTWSTKGHEILALKSHKGDFASICQPSKLDAIKLSYEKLMQNCKSSQAFTKPIPNWSESAWKPDISVTASNTPLTDRVVFLLSNGAGCG